MNSKFCCTGCRDYFPAADKIKINRGSFHSYECATEHGKTKSAKIKVKAEKKSHSAAKRRLKDEDKSFQLKKTQTIFNAYVRLRDHDNNCISCGRSHDGQYHAGHYRSVGSCPELRFDERNCHKQCAPCNNHLSGNLVNYRIKLTYTFGVEFVAFLEGPHKPKRYTIAQLKVLQRWFTRKTKRMEKEL